MPPTELYLAEDWSLYKIKRLSKNPEFFTFEIFSEKDLNSLTDSLTRKNKKSQKNASLEGDNHKAPGIGARTDTREPAPTPAGTSAVDGIYGGDYLH
jgi:hypothetical protein